MWRRRERQRGGGWGRRGRWAGGERQIRAPGGCWAGGRKVRREMKQVRRAAEESGSGSRYLTEITLLPGLPDYSAAPEDNNKKEDMYAYGLAWTETQHLHTPGRWWSNGCGLLCRMDWDVGLDCLYLQVLVCYIRCVSRGRKYIRHTSEFTKAIPPPHSPLLSEQSAIGSYNTYSLLAQTFLLIYVSCLDWDVGDGSPSTWRYSTRIKSQNYPGLMRTRRRK